MSNEKKEPVDQAKLGNIIASIWANQTDKGTFYNVTVQRFYRDGENWKYTDSFGRDDLLLVRKVLDTAHTKIYELLAADKAAA